MIPERFEFSAGKCLHAARSQNNRIRRLPRRKYFGTHEYHGAKGVSSISVTYYAADNSNMTNWPKKTGMSE